MQHVETTTCIIPHDDGHNIFVGDELHDFAVGDIDVQFTQSWGPSAVAPWMLRRHWVTAADLPSHG